MVQLTLENQKVQNARAKNKKLYDADHREEFVKLFNEQYGCNPRGIDFIAWYRERPELYERDYQEPVANLELRARKIERESSKQ